MNDPNFKGDGTQSRKANAQRKKAELRERRTQQFSESRGITEQLEKDLKTRRANLRLCNELLHHSNGFYEEVNKLARGKTAFPATPLVRQNANDIIQDAKKLIKAKEEVHMDRIKEFVPAGDEPPYPDVLLIIRSVRDCLKRHRKKYLARSVALQRKLTAAATVAGALEYFLNDEEASEEEKECPTKEAVQEYTGGKVNDSCFTPYSDDDTSYYFDLAKLDSMTVQEYLSTIESDDEDDTGSEEDSFLGDSHRVIDTYEEIEEESGDEE